ncbi:MAG: hypothetical protein HYY49_02900 [Ignavibacteriales bacterium]|nr:hypothetical protein [Ignavibacteriales bacterium]
MMLSQVGRIAEQCWRGVPVHFPNVELDEYEVMPNHVHGIVRFRYRRRDVQLNVPTKDPQRLSPKKGTLSVLLRTYKAAVTTICREQALTDFAWQSRFADRVIRDGNDLNRIRRYIKDNVKNWENDEENPRFFAEKNAKRQT